MRPFDESSGSTHEPRQHSDLHPGAWGWWLMLPLIVSAFARDWWTPDEPRYAEVAKEAWTSGNLLVMQLCGEVYPNKPPLLFWIAGGLGRLSDWSEGWMRLTSWGATAATAAMTASLARRWWGRAEAAWSVLVLLGCVMIMRFGAHLQLDLLLMALCTGAVLMVDRARDGEHADRRVLLAGLLVGLGVLTKGPVALLHVSLAVLAWWWAGRPATLTQASRWSWRAALLLALLPAAAWAGAASLAEPSLAEALFYDTHVGRVVQGTRHAGPLWDYLLKLPLQFLPWTAAFWMGLRGWNRTRRQRAHGRTDDVALLRAGTWFLLVFAVFSLIPVKRSLYLMPLYPAMALLAARALVACPYPTRGTVRLAAGTFASVGLLLLVVAGLSHGTSDNVLIAGIEGLDWRASLVGTACLGAAALTMRAASRGWGPWARSLVISMLVTSCLSSVLISQAANPLISDRDLGEFLTTRSEQPSQIPCDGLAPAGVRFYSDRNMVGVKHEHEFLAILDSEGPAFLGIMKEEYFERMSAEDRQRLRVLYRGFEGKDAALVLGAAER